MLTGQEQNGPLPLPAQRQLQVEATAGERATYCAATCGAVTGALLPGMRQLGPDACGCPYGQLTRPWK